MSQLAINLEYLRALPLHHNPAVQSAREETLRFIAQALIGSFVASVVPHPEDVMLWSDGGWCYRHETDFRAQRSDDFRLIAEGTCAHVAFHEDTAAFIAAEGA